MRRLICCSFLPALACLLIFGCGGSDVDLADVEGTVTYDDSPVAGATVTFKPEKGPIASGVTDLEGKYKLRTGSYDGAVIGKHTVTVSAVSEVDGDAGPDIDNMNPESAEYGTMMEAMAEGQTDGENKPKSLIPEKYSSIKSTPLNYEVKDSGDNQFDIKLED